MIRGKKFQAFCKNNTYEDFGNHTGFQTIKRKYDHLIIGNWYLFEKTKYGIDLIINGKKTRATGYNFNISNDYIPECFDFYKFFSTIQEEREAKLNLIGI
jgi:hypothetical protein